MARVTNKGIIGAVGNVVFFEMNGKTYAKSKKGKTPKNKKKPLTEEQSVFQRMVKHGNPMIEGLKPGFHFHFSTFPYNKGRSWMRVQYEAYENGEGLEITKDRGIFSMNPDADMNYCMKMKLQVQDEGNGRLVITIPACKPKMKLRAPSSTYKINLKLVAMSSGFGETDDVLRFAEIKHSILYSETEVPEQELVIETGANPGNICVVALALEYCRNKSDNYVEDKHWLPGALIAMGKLK